MKSEHKALLKQIALILAIGVVAFVVWEIVKAVKAGVTDVASLIKAPFTAVSSIWTGITNLFSGGSSSAGSQSALNPLTAGINDPVTGQPITDESALGNLLLGSPQPTNMIDFSNYPTS